MQREAEIKGQTDRDALKVRLLTQDLVEASAQGQEIRAMSFHDAVYLLSLLRHAGSEDLAFIAPNEVVSGCLSPTIDFDQEIVSSLFRRRLIAIHPHSRADAVIIEDGRLTQYYPGKVYWTLPLEGRDISPAAFMERLELTVRKQGWRESWRDEADDLFRKVALHECLQYLRVVVEEHNFELRVGEKTVIVLNGVLRRHSVAQAYNFMWRAAKDAASFYVRKQASKRHAANTIPGSIQRLADRAWAEGWDVPAYRRHFQAPRSTLSCVLFDTVLEIGEAGFTTVPPCPTAATDPE